MSSSFDDDDGVEIGEKELKLNSEDKFDGGGVQRVVEDLGVVLTGGDILDRLVAHSRLSICELQDVP